ncbi:MAG: hypothetical protein PHY30_00115 [Candidatus Pacebacteria bacterium]|nr:hypothetical protein [Candidatus Paceibacterota bacterium]
MIYVIIAVVVMKEDDPTWLRRAQETIDVLAKYAEQKDVPSREEVLRTKA